MITTNPVSNTRTIEEISQIEEKSVSLTNEPTWLSSLRLKAWDLFKKLPIESDPNMLKFVQPGKLENLEIIYPPTHKVDMTLVTEHTDKKSKLLKIFITNNKITTMFPKNTKDEENIAVSPLFAGINEQPEYFENIISEAYGFKQADKLRVLFFSSFNWGSYIKIKSNATFNNPLAIIFESGEGQNLATSPSMNIIDIGDNTHITLLFEYRSNSSCVNFSHLFIRVGSGSNVKILGVQNEDPEHQQIQSSLLHIYNDAHVSYLTTHIGGKYSRIRNEFRLKGQGAELLEVDNLRGQNEQLYDILSVISHEAANTVGRTFARGVLSDRSKAIFKGIAAIPLEIPNCNS